MRRWMEGLETFAIDVILERRYGRRADVLRWILHGLAAIYRVLVQIRLALYRNRYLRPRSLGCLVISVGNLTVGGTGKRRSWKCWPEPCKPEVGAWPF